MIRAKNTTIHISWPGFDKFLEARQLTETKSRFCVVEEFQTKCLLGAFGPPTSRIQNAARRIFLLQQPGCLVAACLFRAARA